MKTATKNILTGSGAALCLLGLASAASASAGIVGQCADCHTMHNSQQGQAVARIGTTGTVSAAPLPNLLRMDCIACHAQGTGEMVVTMAGGSKIPQVYHDDPSGDLAAGNFAYISGTKEGHGPASNRKGHNVVDVVTADSDFTTPPGFRHADGALFSFDVNKFTCAGQMGCHGMRGQLLQAGDEFTGGEDVFRTGLTALSGYDGAGTSTALFRGAHHSNYDGLKSDGAHPDFYKNPLAHSYRFIRALKGYGNEVDRWQNKDATSHNEYIGGYVNDTLKNTDYATTSTCSRCHTGGVGGETSRLTVPNQTMTGFCITCHSNFHSSGATNGASGAFLRHPSDYVIKDAGEYANYTTYSIHAPVARPVSFFTNGMTPSSEVNPGQDMVMCLSCHVAHAGPYDGMLRFDYTALTSGMRAGNGNQTHAGQGCLACHTAKGGPMP